MTSVALGELLLVAAVPVAVVIAILGAILSARHRRSALAIVGCAVAVMVAMFLTGRHLIAPLTEMRAAQKERFEPVEIGQTREAVREILGEPDLSCPGEGYVAHKARGSAKLEIHLYESTTERWIYFAPGDAADAGVPREGCQPLFGEGEVGFNAAGNVIWYISTTDDTFVTF
jgi:hypothetical protein